uniref:C2H2-type domain-containing protein n=1 Tax=Megaselia scalaris TaxID=36166 RepID=T1GZ30_MEGSC
MYRVFQGFATVGNLDRHMKNHSTDAERRFQCKQCDKTFTQMTNLLRHIQTVHSGLRPFECEVCHKTFTQQGNLQRHQLTHTGEKPFKCKRCGRAFSQRINLKKHSMAHQGFRPYKCELCEMSFVQKPNLTKHMMTHSMKQDDVENIIVEEYPEEYEEDMVEGAQVEHSMVYKEEKDEITGNEATMEMIIEPGKYNYGNVYFQTVGSNYVIPHPSYEVINEEQVKTSD